ncbi:hypothetical protein AB0F13_13990 [Streptomyces sp. NPDC026206]|uniref:hypothetical protein n=1 Tax=Streptomyces sp. NPDC026206 TaxID=3157089 RepID=UPI0034107C93
MEPLGDRVRLRAELVEDLVGDRRPFGRAERVGLLPHRGGRPLAICHRPPALPFGIPAGVLAGTTAVNTGPSSPAKYAPAAATAPPVAAITGARAVTAPRAVLHAARGVCRLVL